MRKSKSNLLQAIRSILILAAVGLLVLNGRKLLPSSLNALLSAEAYYWIAFFVMVLAAWLATKDILHSLRIDAQRNLDNQVELEQKDSADVLQHENFEFREKLGTNLFFLCIGIAFVVSPAISEGRLTFSLQLILYWMLTMIPVLIGIYGLIYRVRIRGEIVAIKGFRETKFSLSDVKLVEIKKPPKGGVVAIVNLRNGNTVKFSESIKDFMILVTLLRSRSRP